jgi:O-methyltransferase
MSLRSLVAPPLRRLLALAGLQVVPRRDPLADLDASVASTVRRVAPYTMTSVERVSALCDAVRYVVDAKIPGDIVECGVWKGGSMMAVALTLLELGEGTRKLHMFDTFEGMTAPTGRDIARDGVSAADLMARSDRDDPESVWCRAPLEGVKAALHGTGYDPARMFFVQGRVEDTVPQHAPERIALLRLDTDWHESTRHELEHLFPRLSPGGVLIIDDYGHWAGARQAVDEYLREHQVPLLLHRVDYTGRSAVKWKA